MSMTIYYTAKSVKDVAFLFESKAMEISELASLSKGVKDNARYLAAAEAWRQAAEILLATKFE